MSHYIVCVDMGGTKTRAALFSILTQELLRTTTLPTPRHESGAKVLDNISQAIAQVIQEDKAMVQAIAIGAPGPLDIRHGVILRAPLFQYMRDVPLLNHIQQAFGIATYVNNDANLAALGEYVYGGGRGSTDMIYVGVGTGVGGGVVNKGQLLSGHAGFGGELGHICIHPDGLLCGCGRRGCLEAYVSGAAIESEAHRAVHQGVDTQLVEVLEMRDAIHVEDIVRCATEGDRVAKDILLNAARDLGIGLASLVNIFNPDCIVIGGGVSNAAGLFLDAVQKEVTEQAMFPMADQVRICQWELGDKAGLYGAFYYGKQMLGLVDA